MEFAELATTRFSKPAFWLYELKIIMDGRSYGVKLVDNCCRSDKTDHGTSHHKSPLLSSAFVVQEATQNCVARCFTSVLVLALWFMNWRVYKLPQGPKGVKSASVERKKNLSPTDNSLLCITRTWFVNRNKKTARTSLSFLFVSIGP